MLSADIERTEQSRPADQIREDDCYGADPPEIDMDYALEQLGKIIEECAETAKRHAKERKEGTRPPFRFS